MVEFLSKPQGTKLYNLYMVFTGGGIHCNGKESPIVSQFTRILIGEPATFSANSERREVGYITTTPTDLLPNENDCTHFSIDGKINCFSIDPLPEERFLTAPTNGYLWDCHSFVSPTNGKITYNDIIMWGSTGSIIFPYPPNACDSDGHKYIGQKAIYWRGTRDYMYVAESKCGYYEGAKISSRVRVCRLGLDATRTKLRVQSFTADAANDSFKSSSIPDLFNILEAGTGIYKLPVGYYSTLFDFACVNINTRNIDVDRSAIIERLCNFSPEPIFPGFCLDLSIFDKKIDWGMLATNCARQLNTLSVNGMAYGADIISLKKQVKSILKLLVDFDDPKAWSSLYLSFHYGLKLTVSDTKSIMSEIIKVNNHNGPAKLQSSSSLSDVDMGISGVAHLSVYYDRCSGAFAKLYYKLLEYDTLFSDMENLWDLVPFSFVIDWFVAVGDLLDQLDATNHSVAFNIPAAEYSIKLERQMDPTLFGLDLSQATLQARWYHRCFIPEAPTPSYSLDIPINQGFGHWIESGALILQKYFN